MIQILYILKSRLTIMDISHTNIIDLHKLILLLTRNDILNPTKESYTLVWDWTTYGLKRDKKLYTTLFEWVCKNKY